MLYSFTRLADENEQRAFMRVVTGGARPPLKVTHELAHEAGELLTKHAYERAAKFGREKPNGSDFSAVTLEHPALTRISRGDMVREDLAEVS